MHLPAIRRRTWGCVLAAVVSVASANSAFAAMNDFVGDWVNVDPATNGVSRVSLRRNGSDLILHAWGRCEPRDCDMGEATVQAFVPSVSAPVEVATNAFIAEFDRPSQKTMMIGHLMFNGFFYVDTFTLWTDNSGRHDYWHGNKFKR